MQWSTEKLDWARREVRLAHPSVKELSRTELSAAAETMHQQLIAAGCAAHPRNVEALALRVPTRLLFGAVHLYLYPMDGDFTHEALQPALLLLLTRRFRMELLSLAWRLVQELPPSRRSDSLLRLLIPLADREETDRPLLVLLREWMRAETGNVDVSMDSILCRHLRHKAFSVQSGLRRMELSFDSDWGIRTMTAFFLGCSREEWNNNMETFSAYGVHVLHNACFPEVFTRFLHIVPVWDYSETLLTKVLHVYGDPSADLSADPSASSFWVSCGDHAAAFIRQWHMYRRLAVHLREKPDALRIWSSYVDRIIRDSYPVEGLVAVLEFASHVAVDWKDRRDEVLFLRKDAYEAGWLTSRVDGASMEDRLQNMSASTLEQWYFHDALGECMIARYDGVHRLYLGAWLEHLSEQQTHEHAIFREAAMKMSNG